MRTGPTLLALALLTGCASAGRAPESPAAYARPEPDPALREAPPGAPYLVPIENVSVRVRRASDGQVAIVEFLSPGLPERDQVALRLAYEAGELRLAGGGTAGDETWVTTLVRPARR